MKAFQILFLFLISTSLIAQNDIDKPKLTKDVLVQDDQIIQGSSCVGIDCNNGENFDFTTIKLKENNLRIKFDDTSTSSSFPSNDWELVANDSNNGGRNKFSLDDVTAGRTPFTILAGAPQDALFVNSTGLIGLGTDDPGAAIHVQKENTPSIRLQQTNNSGFNSQSWDMGANESHFFVRDNQNTKNYPLRIRPAAPHNAVYISETGNVGLGTEFPSATLEVVGNGVFTGTVSQASDERLKKNILPIANASMIINALNAVSYDLKTDEYEELNLPIEKQYGLLAQQLESVLPELVSDVVDDPTKDDESLKAINYMQLIPILVKANQEQSDLINKLMDRVEQLEKAIANK